FIRFLNKWPNSGSSVLVITTHGDAQKISQTKMCELFELNSLDDKAIRKKLKKKYSIQLDILDRHGAIQTLRGNPQKIEYLCFRVQTKDADIRDCLSRLTEDKTELLGLLPEYLADQHGLVEIMALGRLRRPFFSEPLLRYLWDSLDRGGSQQYAQT